MAVFIVYLKVLVTLLENSKLLSITPGNGSVIKFDEFVNSIYLIIIEIIQGNIEMQ